MLDNAVWVKSSRSDSQGGQCVEVAVTPNIVGVRDSKDQNGALLAFTTDGWAAFLAGVKAGEFDR